MLILGYSEVPSFKITFVNICKLKNCVCSPKPGSTVHSQNSLKVQIRQENTGLQWSSDEEIAVNGEKEVNLDTDDVEKKRVCGPEGRRDGNRPGSF